MEALMGASLPRSASVFQWKLWMATRRSLRAASRRMTSPCYRATSVPGLLASAIRCILLINSCLWELEVYFRLRFTFFGGYSSLSGGNEADFNGVPDRLVTCGNVDVPGSTDFVYLARRQVLFENVAFNSQR